MAVVGQEGKVGQEQGRVGQKQGTVGQKQGTVGREQGRAGQEDQGGRVVPGHQEPVGREDHCVWEYV